ncbi:MAG TPA: hypothetical protein VM582_08090 [Candidatus Thermoplasmatota archaeon]|nr:hypothetical protein [Candidatus Thermoplasmatota archaeon]
MLRARTAWLLALLAAPAAALPLPEPALAGPLTHEACADAREAEPFLRTPTRLENLAFDGRGRMYVSAKDGGGILVVTPEAEVVHAIDADAHGIAWGPDGRLYAAVDGGDATTIVRYDERWTPEEVARDVPANNGMAFDDAGDLYVSEELPEPSRPSIVRVPAAAPHEHARWSDVYGANGLAHDAGNRSILAAVSFDQASRILRIMLDDPRDVRTVATLSFGAFTPKPEVGLPPDPQAPLRPKALDDLALGPDGRIYVAAYMTGEVLRVEPRDGSACVLTGGLREPTSVRFARGFGAWDGDLFVTTHGGETGTTVLQPAQARPPLEPAVHRIPLGLPMPPQEVDDRPAPDLEGARRVPAAAPWAALALALLLARRAKP